MKKILCVAMLLPLAACGSSKQEETAQPQSCPQVAVVRDLSRYIDITRSERPTESDVVARAMLRDIEGSCQYDDEGVNMEFTVTLAAVRGPALGGDRITLPYFIAVLDPEDNILRKDEMTVNLELDGDKVTEKKEALKAFVPYLNTKNQDPGLHRIWLGFQLTEAQLARLRGESANGGEMAHE